MVKSEIFGTRPSHLYSHLKKLPNTKLFTHLWFITAIREINPNPLNRYLFIKECLDKDSFFNTEIQEICPYLKDTVPVWLTFIDNDNALLEWEMTPYEKISLTELKHRIIKSTCCKFIEGKGKLGKYSSPFSRFFRSKLGGGFSLTDLDFILVGNNKMVIIEEKTFIDENSGLLGYGQYESFREILNDNLDDLRIKEGEILWFLTFVSNEGIYVYDVLKQGLRERKSVKHPKWGRMICIPMEEMECSSIEDFVTVLKKKLMKCSRS